MKPINFRNETFAELRARLNEDRARVHSAWLAHGPGTTREVAATAQIDILTFRPRSTELYQMGLLSLVDKAGHQGVYGARTVAEWEQFCALRRARGASQMSLI